jgi:hypothetical protein
MTAASEAVEQLASRADDAMREWHSRAGLNSRNANQNALKDVLAHAISSVPILGIPASVLNGMRDTSADGAVQAIHHEAMSAARRLQADIRRTEQQVEAILYYADPEIDRLYALLDEKTEALAHLVEALEEAAASR